MHFVRVAPTGAEAASRGSSTSASSPSPATMAAPCALRHGAGDTGSRAFYARLGFEIEAKAENYEGAGQSSVLLPKTL